jgi:ribosomal protein S18 acetylase RimI-like enzyme
MKLREISAEETLPIRQAVLREGKPFEKCVFEGDKRADTFHFGIFEKEKLLGILSLIANKNPFFDSKNQYQLRGMAVLPEAQGRGLAKMLLKKSEERLSKEKTEILWCNAREKAVGFYAKHQFEIHGNAFEIPGIGTHFLMYKNLHK